MIELLKELFPICRSITGDGVRQTLARIGEHIPLTVHEVPSGTKAFDWVVPPEWNIRDAFIADSSGKRVVDFKTHNLHVLGYSIPVDTVLRLQDLQDHLYSLPDQPEAIPYVTSYYRERWGFCLTQKQRDTLVDGTYRVRIDSDLKAGHLTYGELLIPGQTPDEIFISTYICHPSMANNELSGPVVVTYLAKWLLSSPRRYSYRIVFVPETIGSIVYVSRNLRVMKDRVRAGFNVTCVGDDRTFSFLPSRYGGTLADKVAEYVLHTRCPGFKRYTYLDRGSDERQYCSPGVDLPVVSIMRSKYCEYPEYHTSLDDLRLVTERGLTGSLEVYRECMEILEKNRVYRCVYACEPQLGPRGLYPSLGTKNTKEQVASMMNLLAYADGGNDLIDIAQRIHIPVQEASELAEQFLEAGILQVCPDRAV